MSAVDNSLCESKASSGACNPQTVLDFTSAGLNSCSTSEKISSFSKISVTSVTLWNFSALSGSSALTSSHSKVNSWTTLLGLSTSAGISFKVSLALSNTTVSSDSSSITSINSEGTTWIVSAAESMSSPLVMLSRSLTLLVLTSAVKSWAVTFTISSFKGISVTPPTLSNSMAKSGNDLQTALFFTSAALNSCATQETTSSW